MAAPALVIDTATALCSAALIAGGGVVAWKSELVGRGHAERLLPMIEALLREADVTRPAEILVDCGPGSFTGVRVGLASAIGLAMGWKVAVAGLSSTTLVAAGLFAEDGAPDACAVALSGGHGELFVERFARAPFRSLAPLVSVVPPDAASRCPERLVVGSGADALVAARGDGEARGRLPDARDARLLPESFRLPARPIYGRAPDAKPIAA